MKSRGELGLLLFRAPFYFAPLPTSLLLRRFVFRMAEASGKRVTGDEPQGTMGRVQTAGEARCLLPGFLCAHIFMKRETSGYEAGSPLSERLEQANTAASH